jgi:hypothetical protein
MSALDINEGIDMYGKAKKSLKKLICAGIYILFITASAKATLVNSNSIVVDNIEYYIQTDKSVYGLGEGVELLYTITNLRDEVFLVVDFFPIWDILVTTNEVENFREVWSLHWYGGGPTGPVLFRLEADETWEFTYIWNQIDHRGTPEIGDDTQVSPGVYIVSGVFQGIEGISNVIDTSVAVDITIIPEPGSLVLFGMVFGSLFLCKP